MTPLFLTLSRDAVQLGVALVDRPKHITYTELAEELYGSFAQTLENTDILIVRAPVDHPTTFAAEEKSLKPLYERVPRASLYILSTQDFVTQLTGKLGQMLPCPERDFLLWLRSQELRAYLLRSSALLPSRQGFLYRSPSRKYYKTFLRVGNVQTTTQVLDAFAFWLLPYLRDRDAILVDTWSISSIALNTLRILENYSGTGTRSRILEMMPTYFDGSPQVLQQTLDLLRRIPSAARILVLISAVATGGSLRRLAETLRGQRDSPGQVACLALYKLSTEPTVDALCDLSDQEDTSNGDLDFSVVDDDAAIGATIFDIDARNYFPIEIQQTLVNLRKSAADPGKEFFTAYQGKRVICLHRDSQDLLSNRIRHHGIDFDVEAMLATHRFREGWTRKILELPCAPSLVVAPFHRAGKELADLTKDILEGKFGSRPDVLVHPTLYPPELSESEKTLFKRLAEHDDILVIDDVSLTGERLGRFQKNLRDLQYLGRIHYLVGVARPSSEEIWQTRKRTLQFRDHGAPHQLDYVEKVLVPNWNENDCPWCTEQRILKNLLNDSAAPESVKELATRRAVVLGDAPSQTGLVDNVFWRVSETPTAVLTKNSIFLDYDGDASESDVVGAVAAAIQWLRNAHGLEAIHPHISVIDPDDYLGTTTFTDATLRLAILRTARRGDLVLWQNLETLKYKEKLGDLLFRTEPDQEVIRLEMALGALERKLFQLQPNDDEQKALAGSEAGRVLQYALST